MTIIDGKKISEKKLKDIEDEIKKRNWIGNIGLAVIIIGSRKDSKVKDETRKRIQISRGCRL